MTRAQMMTRDDAPAGVRDASPRKTDRRTRKTRNQLSRALVSLLRTKPLTAITVKELTELADVNRATFYAHYRDVFDIYAQVKQDICQTFRNLVEEHAEELGHERYDGLIHDLLSYLATNDDDAAIILGTNGDGTFLSDIIEVIRDGGFDAITQHASPETAEMLKRAPELCNYHFYFLAGGVASMLRTWLNGGCRESIDTIAQMATSYVGALSQSLLAKNIERFEAQGA